MLQVHTLHTLITNCKDIINKERKESWKESNATQIQFLLLTCETTLASIQTYTVPMVLGCGYPSKTDKIYPKLSSSPYSAINDGLSSGFCCAKEKAKPKN